MIDREDARLIGLWGSVPRANARLLQLVRAGYMERRWVPSREFGRKALYSLRRAGKGEGYPGRLFVEHQVAVNQIYLHLKYQTRDQARFVTWRTFRQPITPWLSLVPDAYVELEIGGKVEAIFLEVDRGTETGKVFQKKIELYPQLATSGVIERVFQRTRFKVLVIVSTVDRLEFLRPDDIQDNRKTVLVNDGL